MFKPVEKRSAFGGKIVRLYYCAREAAEDNNIDYPTMLKLIHSGERYRYHIYNWYYEEGHPTILKKFPLVQYRDGVPVNRFSTTTEAANVLNVGRNIISRWCKSQEPDWWGCIWKDSRIADKEKFDK